MQNNYNNWSSNIKQIIGYCNKYNIILDDNFVCYHIAKREKYYHFTLMLFETSNTMSLYLINFSEPQREVLTIV